MITITCLILWMPTADTGFGFLGGFASVRALSDSGTATISTGTASTTSSRRIVALYPRPFSSLLTLRKELRAPPVTRGRTWLLLLCGCAPRAFVDVVEVPLDGARCDHQISR